MPKAIKIDEAGQKAGELPFEEAITRLESIVEAMESDDLPLETMISKFEEGTRLTEHCKARLAEAEVKIAQLEKKSSGEIRVTSIDLTVQSPQA